MPLFALTEAEIDRVRPAVKVFGPNGRSYNMTPLEIDGDDVTFATHRGGSSPQTVIATAATDESRTANTYEYRRPSLG